MAWINGVEVPDSELPLSGAFAFQEFLSGLHGKLRDNWEAAELEYHQPTFQKPELEKDEFGCLWPVPGLLCPATDQKYSSWPVEPCTWLAGRGTDHEGIGLCRKHDGYRNKGARRGAILMAMLFADEMQVSPWEALLSQVRLLANQVRWLRYRVEWAETMDGADAIKPDGSGWHWVCLLEARGDRLAKVAKMAIDAGVAQALVSQINLEADHMAQAAIATMDKLGIYGAQREEALDFMAGELERLERAS